MKKSPKAIYTMKVRFVSDFEHKMQLFNLIKRFSEQLNIVSFPELPICQEILKDGD